ncbi:MAG: capsular polysaccharide synthesis protein [Lachnospiraceae bacterium]|nr:capsular polysaccharide synthesis protein [Lachnospiraceae bacterium]
MKFSEKTKVLSDISKQFGLGFALKYAYLLKTRQYKRYIDFISGYLETLYKDDLAEFDKKHSINDINECNESVRNVFVCWWQGYESMPVLCKACYKQLQSVLSDDYNLIFITKDNYKGYVDIPQYILDKVEKGMIPVTQFSDVLRQGLVATNGGIWIDSTIWVNEGINNYISRIGDFWSVRLPKIYNEMVIGQLISSCRWSSFIVGGKKGSPVFQLMFDCMCKYYKTHDTAIDYYLQNLLYKMIFEKSEYCKATLNTVAVSNRYLYDLKNVFNKPFDDKEFGRMNTDTSIFKLTYKVKYKEINNGNETFYGHIIRSFDKNES